MNKEILKSLYVNWNRTRTSGKKEFKFKVNKIYKVKMSHVNNFHRIYHGKQSFQHQLNSLKTRFIDEEIIPNC
jgi:hypothetical protein